MPGPYAFSSTDWADCDVALEERQWINHIMRNRGWNDRRMISLIRQTVTDPDVVFESDRDARRAELWRYFDDVKDGQSGLVKVIVEYDTVIAQATSDDIVTAMVAPAVSSRGARLWKRP
jgi:hypothetical protein